MILKMDKVNDIKHKLLKELKWGRIKDCGYNCTSGRKYVEIRNALFEVDRFKIFENIPPLEHMSTLWYDENYDPILERNNQFNKCIYKLLENPNTRQAVIIMGDVNEFDNDPLFICTMYMHIFLNHIKDNDYELEYIVHMRSNDAIEFDTDILWHYTVINRMIKQLKVKYNIVNKKIIWNADTIHLYSQFFDEAQK